MFVGGKPLRDDVFISALMTLTVWERVGCGKDSVYFLWVTSSMWSSSLAGEKKMVTSCGVTNNLFVCLFVSVNNCGAYPVVPNSVAVKESEYILKYQCNNYYKHDGPETVMCHSDGSWSELPVCKGINKSISPFIIPKVYQRCCPNN